MFLVWNEIKTYSLMVNETRFVYLCHLIFDFSKGVDLVYLFLSFWFVLTWFSRIKILLVIFIRLCKPCVHIIWKALIIRLHCIALQWLFIEHMLRACFWCCFCSMNLTSERTNNGIFPKIVPSPKNETNKQNFHNY